jgi:primase-polymerase (primpol)-like protein
MSDEELLLRARNARNGAKFTALFDEADLKAHRGDDSSADMALCCMLTFWSQDRTQLDRFFRTSRLMRPKWDEIHYGDGTTYGEGTIRRALERTCEHYRPPPPQRAARTPPMVRTPALAMSRQCSGAAHATGHSGAP